MFLKQITDGPEKVSRFHLRKISIQFFVRINRCAEIFCALKFHREIAVLYGSVFGLPAIGRFYRRNHQISEYLKSVFRLPFYFGFYACCTDGIGNMISVNFVGLFITG